MPQSVLKNRTAGEVKAHPVSIRGIARLTGLDLEETRARIDKLPDACSALDETIGR